MERVLFWIARVYFETAFETNQKTIVQDLVTSIYGVGLDANNVEQVIRVNCSLYPEGNSLNGVLEGVAFQH